MIFLHCHKVASQMAQKRNYILKGNSQPFRVSTPTPQTIMHHADICNHWSCIRFLLIACIKKQNLTLESPPPPPPPRTIMHHADICNHWSCIRFLLIACIKNHWSCIRFLLIACIKKQNLTLELYFPAICHNL